MADEVVSTKQKIAELDPKLVNEFNRLYPQKGAWTWFVREALTKFLALHDTTPDDKIAEAVRNITIKHSE